MPCYQPVDCYQKTDGSIIFSERGDIRRALRLPCGNCIGCRLERKRQWQTRCIHESQMHKHSSFVTLTYEDKHIPQGGSLDHRDFQLFMKRLRNSRQDPIRFYMCGEYGNTTNRPHYHALLFGAQFHDQEKYSTDRHGNTLYTSKELDELWQKGMTTLGTVNETTAAYCAGYTMKKRKEHAEIATVHLDTGEIRHKTPEYGRMSLRPGIGATWIKKHLTDVFTQDAAIFPGGRRCKTPRYYYNYLKKTDSFAADQIEYERQLKALAAPPDHTHERLRAREAVAAAREAFALRNQI